MNDPNLRRLLDIAKGEGSKRNTDIRHFAFIDKDGIGESFNTQKERDEYCNQQENILKDFITTFNSIENDIKYMPFVGDVSGRPSVLNGSPEELIKKAKECLQKGVYGFDLLGYRYTGDAFNLNKKFISEVDAPVCLAGSINSFDRLNEVLIAAPKYFTIGGAFFNKCFGESFPEQLDAVYNYVCNHSF